MSLLLLASYSLENITLATLVISEAAKVNSCKSHKCH